MKSSSLLKLTLFFLFTTVFVTGLIAYSNSRGNSSSNGESNSASADESFSDDQRNRRYEKQFSVKDGGEIIVNADAGTVKIDSWEKSEVSVVVEVDGSDSRAEKYTVEFKQEGNTVYVTGKVKDRSFFKWHIGNLEVLYTIYVPKKFNTTVKTSGGDVESKNLIGKADYYTSGGNIEVEKIEGETVASTSGGNVNVRDIVGNVEAETSGGNVVCENIKGDVNGSTSGGDVEANFIDGRVKAGTSGGNVTIKVNGENKGINAETSGGDIDIFVKEGVGADIDAETTGGSVDCDLPVTVRGKVRDSELHGKLNGGGNVIRASTSGGSIRIATLK
ncbi:MAG: DUF4097 family beta strand repeat-containing protein [Bacteroidota bacterium]|nr:DUF4097 family beta strand repeat-containing protein [Bacteroidota bacterium]